MILTDEEIQRAINSVGWYCPDTDYFGYTKGFNAIAKAQLKKVYEEGRKQLFRDKPLPDEVCHLTLDMWEDLFKIDRGSFAKYVKELEL